VIVTPGLHFPKTANSHGRLASNERWAVPISFRPDPRINDIAFYDPEVSNLTLSRDGTVCVACSGDQIAIVDMHARRQQQMIKAPGIVHHVRASCDGKRILAECFADPDSKDILVNTADGRSTTLSNIAPFNDLSTCIWVGNDHLAVINAPFVLVKTVTSGQSRQKAIVRDGCREANSNVVRMLSRWEPMEGGPMAVNQDGTLFAVTGLISVSVFDTSNLALKFPALSIPGAWRLRGVSVSEDGRTVVVTDGFHIFNVDMEKGTAREIVPYVGGRVARSLEFILPSIALLGVCAWLFYRFRPSDSQKDVATAIAVL